MFSRILVSVIFICIALCASSNAADQAPAHQCAVQLKLNSHEAGYSGTGTATLVRRGDAYYLVTALHNLQRATNGLTIALEPNVYLNKSYFAEQFVFVPASDLVVAKFLGERLTDLIKSKFLPLLSDVGSGVVLNPVPGEGLAAVGNPVFAYESSNRLQANIVYEGMVAEYASPGILIGDAGDISDEMMILESLSIMPGFSGGPLLLVRDRETRRAEVAGIVVGGDPRAIVSPGRFVFAVPPTRINDAIEVLERRLAGGEAASPTGFVLIETDLRKVPRPNDIGFRYGVERVAVIDVTNQRYLAQVNNEFLSKIAAIVKNSDMVFHGGIFGNVDLGQLQPTRATFVGCRFKNEEALATANLMGARFIDCVVMPPDGSIARPVRVTPTLGYGITIIDGRGNESPQPEFEIVKERTDGLAKTDDARVNADDLRGVVELDGELLQSESFASKVSPEDQPVRLSSEQFNNLLTRDLFKDE